MVCGQLNNNYRSSPVFQWITCILKADTHLVSASSVESVVNSGQVSEPALPSALPGDLGNTGVGRGKRHCHRMWKSNCLYLSVGFCVLVL